MSNTENKPDMTPGIISWNELVSRDTAGSQAFYTQLFGWKADKMPVDGIDYTIFKVGERPVAGLISLPPEAHQAPTAWMGYITVEDIAQAVEKAKSLGAKVCRDITPLPMGTFAVIADPQGGVFGLWQFKEGATC